MGGVKHDTETQMSGPLKAYVFEGPDSHTRGKRCRNDMSTPMSLGPLDLRNRRRKSDLFRSLRPVPGTSDPFLPPGHGGPLRSWSRP